MPRAKKLSPQVRREIYLPAKIAELLDQLFLDPLTGKARYGYVNTYINALVRQDLERRGLFNLAKKPLDSAVEPPYNNGNVPPSTQE